MIPGEPKSEMLIEAEVGGWTSERLSVYHVKRLDPPQRKYESMQAGGQTQYTTELVGPDGELVSKELYSWVIMVDNCFIGKHQTWNDVIEFFEIYLRAKIIHTESF